MGCIENLSITASDRLVGRPGVLSLLRKSGIPSTATPVYSFHFVNDPVAMVKYPRDGLFACLCSLGKGKKGNDYKKKTTSLQPSLLPASAEERSSNEVLRCTARSGQWRQAKDVCQTVPPMFHPPSGRLVLHSISKISVGGVFQKHRKHRIENG